MNSIATRIYVLLFIVLIQAPAFARPPTDAPATATDSYRTMPIWREHLVHDWDFLRGRPGPLHQALAAVRRDLQRARDLRFRTGGHTRPGEYLQRANARLHDIRRMLHNRWKDPMFAERLDFVTRGVQGMVDGTLSHTPALFEQLDRELKRLLHWRWAP